MILRNVSDEEKLVLINVLMGTLTVKPPCFIS